MKRFMMAVLVTLAAMFATFPAFAGQGLSSEQVGSAGFNKLSEAEKAEVIKMVADKAAAQKADVPGTLEKVVDKVTPTAEGVDKWITVGERFGKMMGGAAKEVGVAVNEFVKTPVGMMTAVLIVWSYMGGMIIHVFGGLLVLVIGLYTIRVFVNRQNPYKYEYDVEHKNVFGNPVIKSKKREPMSDDSAASYLFASAIVLIISLACMFSY